MTRLPQLFWLLLVTSVVAGCSIADQFTYADCRMAFGLCEEYCGNRCTDETSGWTPARCQQCTDKCKVDGQRCDRSHAEEASP